jgi:glycosyltransferase involved in cell wall biosynthesis
VESSGLSAIWFDQRRSRLRRLLFDTIALPRIARQSKPDAVLALGNIGLLQPPIPQAILVHDPHFVYPREFHGNMTWTERLRYAFQRGQIRRCMRHSMVIYGQTPLMLERMGAAFGEHPGFKLLPTCAAGSPTPKEGPGCSGVVAKTLGGCADRFRLICLCRYYAHKNLEIICDGFEQFGSAMRDVVVFITVAAGQHPHAKSLLDRIHRSGLSDRIINLGPIPETEIPACLGNCEGLLFPTLMESFSGTYLDAMQCGLPILTSDLDFAHQTCGEAAVFFDPSSPKAMVEAINHLKSDASLRRQLAEAGRDWLHRVYAQSWTEVAAQVVADLRICVSKDKAVAWHS